MSGLAPYTLSSSPAPGSHQAALRRLPPGIDVARLPVASTTCAAQARDSEERPSSARVRVPSSQSARTGTGARAPRRDAGAPHRRLQTARDTQRKLSNRRFDNDARIAITALPLRMREHPPGRSLRTATPTVLQVRNGRGSSLSIRTSRKSTDRQRAALLLHRPGGTQDSCRLRNHQAPGLFFATLLSSPAAGRPPSPTARTVRPERPPSWASVRRGRTRPLEECTGRQSGRLRCRSVGSAALPAGSKVRARAGVRRH